MTTNDDLLRGLGRVEEGVSNARDALETLRDDFRDEKLLARESRAVIHKRLDEQQAQISRVDSTIAIGGKVEAQLRDELAALRRTVEENQAEAAPTLADIRRMKTIGIGISGLIALGGLTFGGILLWMGEAAVTAIRLKLRIP